MASPLIISSASLERVRVRVRRLEAGVVVDPTGDTVAMAFTVDGAAPVSGDWKTADWQTDTSTSPTTYRARCLVGPGGAVTLAAGLWSIWVKVTDNPEVPVKPAGTLKVI